MAKADWCTVAPMSGNGDGTLTISAPAHTGRTQRSTAVTVQAQNGAKPSATIQVIQAGAGTATTMDETHPDVPPSGERISIHGTSNSAKLTWRVFIVLPNGMEIEGSAEPITGEANGEPIGRGQSIAGDPGAQAAYAFTLSGEVKSGAASDMTFKVLVIDDAGNERACRMIMKAGASRVSVSETSAPITGAGGSDTIEVASNDDWTVS